MNRKKELREQYKAQKMKIGVFQVRNTLNGKIYIDSSSNLDAIWNRHRTELNYGNHRNETLQKEWKEFGEKNFRFEILSEIPQKDGDEADYTKEARELAKMFIDELQPFGERGYNPKKA